MKTIRFRKPTAQDPPVSGPLPTSWPARTPCSTLLTTDCLDDDPVAKTFVESRLPFMSDAFERHRFIRDTRFLIERNQSVRSRYRRNPPQSDRTIYGGLLQNPGYAKQFFTRLLYTDISGLPIDIREVMLCDPQVHFGLGIWKGFLKGLDFWIDCPDSTQRTFLERTVRDVYMKAVRPIVDGGLEHGHQSCEIVWHLDQNFTLYEIEGTPPRRKVIYKRPTFLIKYIKDHHPRNIQIKLAPTGELAAVITKGVGGNNTELKPGLKLMFTGFNQRSGNWFGRSMLVPVSSPFYWKQVSQIAGLRYYERQGSAQMKVRAPDGYYQLGDGEELYGLDIGLRMAASMVATGVMVMPSTVNPATGKPEWDVTYEESGRKGEMWVNWIDYWDSQILHAMLYPDKAVADKARTGGTSAAAVSGRDIWLTVLGDPISVMEENLNEYLVDPLYRTNFLEKDRVGARLYFYRPDFDRRPILRKAVETYVTNLSGMYGQGILTRKVPDIEAAGRAIGVPMRDTYDILMDVKKDVARKEAAQPAEQQDISQDIQARLAAGQEPVVTVEE